MGTRGSGPGAQDGDGGGGSRVGKQPPARRDPAPSAHSRAGRRPPPRPDRTRPPARDPLPPARGRPGARTHRGGGLPGGGHDGGQRSRHVIAAHTPAPAAARRKRKAERAPGRAQGRASGESGPPTGARSGACAPPGPAPPSGPARPCRTPRRCPCVTMSGRAAPGWLRPRAASADLLARAAHAPCGRRAWWAGARGHC